MRSLKRHLSPGLAALAVLGFAAGTAAAAPAPPDLVPFIDTDSGSSNAVAMSKWYVDVTASPSYSARLHFGTQIGNLATAGPFQIIPGAASGSSSGRTAVALQVIKDGTNKALTSVKLIGDPLGVSGNFNWGIDGMAKYTLTPPSGPAVNSALGAVCRDDSSNFVTTPPAPAVFDPAVCSALDNNATNFFSGISPGYQDVVGALSDNTAYFDITNVAAGAGSFTAKVDPNNEIDEATPTDANNTDTEPFTVPGVSTQPATLTTLTTTPASAILSAHLEGQNVLGRTLNPALDPADPAQPVAKAATGILTFVRVTNGAHGTATIDPTTGKAVYTAAAGFTGADSFSYYAQDSRGIRSATTTVTVNVGGGATTPGGGGTVTPGGGGATPPVVITKITLKLKPSFAVIHQGKKNFLQISGSLPKTQAGRTIKIQRKVGRKISTLATVKIGKKGHYSKLIHVTSRTILVRATIASSKSAKASTSAFRSLMLVKNPK